VNTLVDVAIYRWFNRLADHTGWAHGFFRLSSNLCIGLFALLVVGAAIEGRQSGRATQVAASVWRC
jgi:hypothetical protein